MKNRLYLVLVLAALVCVVGWTARAQYTRTVPRQAWEYQQVEFDFTFGISSRLNQLGSEGWELVGVTSSCPSNSKTTPGCKYVAYMKREK